MSCALPNRPSAARGWLHWGVRHIRTLLVLAFVALGLLYSAAAPIFEKNDESLHFAFARHLASGGALPVQHPGVDSAWRQIGSQPPLYYALASLVVRSFDTGDFGLQRQPNQSPQYDPYAPGNKNVLVITPEKRAFGWRDTALAAFVLRVLGIGAGVVAVLTTWTIAAVVTQRPFVAALATAFTAFNPMLISASTAVSNDGLVIALSSLALYAILRATMRSESKRDAVLIGGLIGLASLAKVSGAVLLPVAVVASLLDTRPWRSRLLNIVIILMTWLLVAGWWFARNQALYGDLTGTSAMAAVAGARQLELASALNEFQGLRMSYLALFGHFNIPASDVVYMLWDGLLLVCGLGFILHVVRGLRLRAHSRSYWVALELVALHLALTLAALVRWTLMTTASEGRLLFPCIAGASFLMALGVAEWRVVLRLAGLPARLSRLAVLTPAGALGALAIVAPFVYVLPAYTPPFVRASEIPAGFIPVRQTLSPWAEVVAYRMEPADVRPGEQVRVSVILRALKVPEFNHSLVVNLYGRDNAPLARFDTFTGNGLLPSSQWRVGDVWRDTVAFRVPPDAQAPAILRAQFNLYNAGSGEIAQSMDADGRPGAPLYDGGTLLPLRQPTATRPEATFGDIAALDSHTLNALSPDGVLEMSLNWRSLKRAPADYAMFVHVVDATGEIRAQSDAPPLSGQYPTSRWAAAAFTDTRAIQLPRELRSGNYRVLIGLYDPLTGERLDVRDSRGAVLEGKTFVLGEIVLP